MYTKFIKKLREEEREPFFWILANYPIKLSEKNEHNDSSVEKKKKKKKRKGFPKISNLA